MRAAYMPYMRQKKKTVTATEFFAWVFNLSPDLDPNLVWDRQETKLRKHLAHLLFLSPPAVRKWGSRCERMPLRHQHALWMHLERLKEYEQRSAR